MLDGKRARRRGAELRMKDRARRVMLLWFGRRGFLEPRRVGLNGGTHCRPCGCWMCQEPRKDVPRPRERAFDGAADD